MFGMVPFERSDNNVFDSFDNFARDFFKKSNADLPAFRADIIDTGECFLLEAELPGFKKEDITLELKDNILTITAAHGESAEQRAAQNNYVRRERRWGSFQRSFDISGIDPQGITAAYENGILTLSLPRMKPVEPETHRIVIQ